MQRTIKKNIRLRLLLLTATFLVHGYLHATPDSPYVHHLLLRIQQLQSQGNKDFPKGLFPSWRQYALNSNTAKPDDNIFYTGLIVFTLKQYYPSFNKEDKAICDAIFQNATPVFDFYKNRSGRNTYNFWQNNPPVLFPNSGWINLFNKSKSLPDDADDTVISLLALGADMTVADSIHQYLKDFGNTKSKTITNTFQEYRQLPAYSTWFGKKMPIDFDVSVLCNVLYFIQHHQLKWQAEDSASFQLIKSVLFKNQFDTDAAYVSPHYHRPEIILYHYARLLPLLASSTAVDSSKAKVKEALKLKYAQSTSFMDKVVMNTAMMRLGEPSSYLMFPSEDDWYNTIEQSGFIFFIADIASMFTDGSRKFIASTNLTHFNYYCPAYNLALVLECLMEQRKQFSIQQN